MYDEDDEDRDNEMSIEDCLRKLCRSVRSIKAKTLSFRDQCAIGWMIRAHEPNSENYDQKERFQIMAEACFDFADAMDAERRRRNK